MSAASRQPAWQVASARNCNRSYCRIISASSENHPSQGFSQADTGQGVRVFVCVLSAIYCGSSLHHHLAVPGPVPLGQVSPSQSTRDCGLGHSPAGAVSLGIGRAGSLVTRASGLSDADAGPSLVGLRPARRGVRAKGAPKQTSVAVPRPPPNNKIFFYKKKKGFLAVDRADAAMPYLPTGVAELLRRA